MATKTNETLEQDLAAKMQKLPRDLAARHPKELLLALSRQQSLGRHVPHGRCRSHARPRDSTRPPAAPAQGRAAFKSRRDPKTESKPNLPATPRRLQPGLPAPLSSRRQHPSPTRPAAALRGRDRPATCLSFPCGGAQPEQRRHPPAASSRAAVAAGAASGQRGPRRATSTTAPSQAGTHARHGFRFRIRVRPRLFFIFIFFSFSPAPGTAAPGSASASPPRRQLRSRRRFRRRDSRGLPVRPEPLRLGEEQRAAASTGRSSPSGAAGVTPAPRVPLSPRRSPLGIPVQPPSPPACLPPSAR